MTATIIVQPEAEADLAEAFGWYQRRQQGLGHDFLAEIDRVFERIAMRPLQAAPVWREARRVTPKRFPYSILYVAREDHVYIIAVLHQRRDPVVARNRAEDFDAG